MEPCRTVGRVCPSLCRQEAQCGLWLTSAVGPRHLKWLRTLPLQLDLSVVQPRLQNWVGGFPLVVLDRQSIGCFASGRDVDGLGSLSRVPGGGRARPESLSMAFSSRFKKARESEVDTLG